MAKAGGSLKQLRKIYTTNELRQMGVIGPKKARKRGRKAGAKRSSAKRSSAKRSSGGTARCTIRSCIALVKRKQKERAERAARHQARLVKRVEAKPHLLKTTGGSYGGGSSGWGSLWRGDADSRRKKKRGRGGKKRGHGGSFSRGARGMGAYGSRSRGRGWASMDADMRDWPGQPVRHKRAAALGWQRRLRGKRPKNPTFFGRRPVRSSARKKSKGKRGRSRRDVNFSRDMNHRGGYSAHDHRGYDRDRGDRGDRSRDRGAGGRFESHRGGGDRSHRGGYDRGRGYDMRDQRGGYGRGGGGDMRDWPGEPVRHKRAAVLGWQRRLRGRKPKNPTFFGRRPIQSPFHPRRKKKRGRGRRDASYRDTGYDRDRESRGSYRSW